MAETSKPTPPHEHESSDKCDSACGLSSHATTSAQADWNKSDAEWKQILSPEAYRVLRLQGTEPPFRNAYYKHKEKGVYVCAGCQAPLFASKEKYDSGSGWPAFYDTIAPQFVGETRDTSHGMVRTEVHCSRCGGHLGHVFNDGPRPTGLRYCINSLSLDFVPKKSLAEHGLESYQDHAK